MSEAVLDHHEVGEVPVDIEIIEHVWIVMSDGVRLSAKVWLPKDAEERPVPALLEFIPYRKGDAVAVRDHRNHAWFAARGYACIRPDMRGHGDSEGIMLDEYLPQEQQDAVEVIEWLARQPWCDGNVGMFGISWGGIASMQATTHQPEALKAIIPVGASVDRYYDDGGYLVGGYPGQGLGWGGVMFGYCIRPPDPATVGVAWRDMWLERLEQTPMFAEKWLRHQLRDETWQQGSVCEAYDRIKIPVLGVSGWNDCWPNTMIRLLENISAPCKVVSGPWGHVYPNLGGPGPCVGFLQLALEWWDHWLKGEDNAAMSGPDFLAYIQDSHAPDPKTSDRPGRWVGIDDWCGTPRTPREYGLAAGQLIDGRSATAGSVSICSPLSLGLDTGEYMPIAGAEELPRDQGHDDANSLCFDSAPLEDGLELLGTPTLQLHLASDCNHGLIAARLCDVAPDGASTLISYGVLNLKLRHGRESIAPVIPGGVMDVTLRLNDTGWRLASGHRLRLALSTQLWPMAWPMPEAATLTLDLAECVLEVPECPPSRLTEIPMPFEEAVAADPPPLSVLRPASGSRNIRRDSKTGEASYEVFFDGGETTLHSSGLTFGSSNEQRYLITDGDAQSARAEYRAGFSFQRGDWQVRTESELIVTCTDDAFLLDGRVAAFEGKNQVFTRHWEVEIPREVY